MTADRFMFRTAIVLVLVVVVGIPGATQGPVTSVGFDQSFVVTQGEYFSVPVVAHLGYRRLGAVTLSITYDNAVLRATNCMADPAGVLQFPLCNAQAGPNEVRMTGIHVTGVSHDIAMLWISFQAIGAAGESSLLNVTAEVWADTDGEPIEPPSIAVGKDGVVRVSGLLPTPMATAMPTPTPLPTSTPTSTPTPIPFPSITVGVQITQPVAVGDWISFTIGLVDPRIGAIRVSQ